MNNSRQLRILLCLVLGATFWPIFLSLRPPEIKVQSTELAGISISGCTLVPFVIAASFTRITDDDNNLVFKTDVDARAASTRESIFALIEHNPGIHFRDICRRLEKEIGVVQYHVYILKKFGLITSEKDGRFTRFYAKNARFDDVARNILASWQRPVEKTILSLLASNGEQRSIMKSVMSSCAVTSQAVTWHLNRLKANGLLQDGDPASPALAIPARDRITSLAKQGIIQFND
nr:hypothetical protein [Candidatus Sigynarchaeota archaeon]